jgi:hypothetical protein
LAQCAGNGVADKPRTVLHRDDDIDPHWYLHSSHARRDVSELNTRGHGSTKIGNVRATGIKPSADCFNLN